MRTLQQVFRRRSSLGSSSNSCATPHLLASPPSNDSAIGPLAVPPPAPPVAATSPRGPQARGSRRSTCGSTPPRPSPDNTIATRKSYGTCISQSDNTQIATNVTKSVHRASDYQCKRATKAAAAAVLKCTEGNCDGNTLYDDDDESDTISDLTALSAAYNSGAQTEVDEADQANSAETTKEKELKKPKSIFRRKLKYTKPQLSFGRSSGSGRTPKAKRGGGIPLSPPRKFRADDMSALLAPSRGTCSQTSQQHPQEVASPKTPKTEITEEASLDYSTDEAESSSVSRKANRTAHGGNGGVRWEVHTPPHQTHKILHPLARGNEHMSTPSAPTIPSSSDSSSTSLSSAYSGDTFSTLTTKSSTNPSIKSAPATACVDSNTAVVQEQATLHRRAKSQEQMDELFATILSITDAPGRGIEDMLKANKTVQSQAMASSCRRKKQESNVNAIANIGFVEHEARARARESGAGDVLAPRFESYAEAKAEQQDPRRMTVQPPQLPMVPGERRHRRLPSREERMLAAPRMPLFPPNEPQGSRNKSVDSIERGRQSPHVQFREERLCSFYSSGGNINDVGREVSVDLFGDEGVTSGELKEFGYGQEEERLDSGIYQTLLSMEAFDVKVEDIDDLSKGDDELEGSCRLSTPSSLAR